MAKFKIGDRVRITRSGDKFEDCFGGWDDGMSVYVNDGNIYTIADYDIDYADSDIDYGNEDGRVGYYFDEIDCVWDERLLEPAGAFKFQPGDKVLISRSGKDLYDCAFGWNDPKMGKFVNDGAVYVIAKGLLSDGRPGYLFEDESCFHDASWYLTPFPYKWDERCLELVDDCVEPEFSINDLFQWTQERSVRRDGK